MKLPLTPLRCLNRAVDYYGHKEGVVCNEKRFTYGEFGARCGRLASALVKAGIVAGDRVGYLGLNTHCLLEAYFGIPQAHAMLMPLNVRLTPPEIGQILHHSEPRLLFCENDFAPLVAALLKAAPGLRTINLDTEYEDFLSTGTPDRPDILAYDEDSIAELFYTSGSTGTPKGVMLSHRTIYMHTMMISSAAFESDSDVELHTIPLFHANGWGRVQCATMMGVKQVMIRRFDPAHVFRLIQDEKITGMSLVPTMANALLHFPEAASFDISSTKQIMIGGAASSPELVERLEKLFHCKITAGYGLTETAPVACVARDKSTVTYVNDLDRYRHESMAGWPLPGCEVRVVDAGLHDVPRDMTAVGEVVICGDNVMDGYYRDPEATKAVMTGAWFHSGDMAVWDKEGMIQIVDRRKDIIISGGENISSIEVENAIAAHPAVAEVAVVSAPDQTWGEIPVAIVVLKPGVLATEKELHEFAAQRIAKFKLPRRFEFSAEALPKGGTGKILKRELREKYWQLEPRRIKG